MREETLEQEIVAVVERVRWLGAAGLALGIAVGWIAVFTADDAAAAGVVAGRAFWLLLVLVPLIVLRTAKSGRSPGVDAVAALVGALASSALFYLAALVVSTVFGRLDWVESRATLAAAVGVWKPLLLVVAAEAAVLFTSR